MCARKVCFCSMVNYSSKQCCPFGTANWGVFHSACFLHHCCFGLMSLCSSVPVDVDYFDLLAAYPEELACSLCHALRARGKCLLLVFLGHLCVDAVELRSSQKCAT